MSLKKMRWLRVAFAGILLALPFESGPASAFNVQYNWKVVFGNGFFPSSFGNHLTAGPVNGGSACTVSACASNACGTITAGDPLEVIYAVEGSAGDPGVISTPTGWTSKWQFLSGTAYRSAAFTKTATGSESCATGFDAAWTDATPNAVSYVLIDHTYTGGSLPGSAVDNAAGQAYFDSTGDIQAPSVTLTNAGDLVDWVGAIDKEAEATCPSGWTNRADTHVDAGTFNFLEIEVCDKVIVASGATGTVSGSYPDTFKRQVNGLIGFNQPTGGAAINNQGMMSRGAQ